MALIQLESLYLSLVKMPRLCQNSLHEPFQGEMSVLHRLNLFSVLNWKWDQMAWKDLWLTNLLLNEHQIRHFQSRNPLLHGERIAVELLPTNQWSVTIKYFEINVFFILVTFSLQINHTHLFHQRMYRTIVFPAKLAWKVQILSWPANLWTYTDV